MNNSKTFCIGKFEFGQGASLAPMAGISNPPFRKLCRDLGASFCVTELISCHAVVYSLDENRQRKKSTEYLRTQMTKYQEESPYVVQLYGRDLSLMAEAARLVEQCGADIIDLNFGCPARKVIKNGEGSGVALMLDPVLLGQIVEAVVKAVSIPVTAKIRLGYFSHDKNGVEVARIIEDKGSSLITVHARTREQGHSGPVDYEYLKKIVESVDIPIIGNGGIFSAQDAQKMKALTGCSHVAVGQGAKGNPWIFQEIAKGKVELDFKTRMDTCRRHLNLYLEWADELRACKEMRKHACWYLKGFDGAAAFRKRLGEATSAAVFHSLLDEVCQVQGV